MKFDWKIVLSCLISIAIEKYFIAEIAIIDPIDMFLSFIIIAMFVYAMLDVSVAVATED